MSLGQSYVRAQDGLGIFLSGAQVYWCTQPATTDVNPPSPLAPIYTDLTGDTPLTQPVETDGFGLSAACLEEGVLFTVVVWHPLYGQTPQVYINQILGGGSGGTTLVAFSGIPTGTINGSNTVFTFAVPANPTQLTVWLNFPLILGIGYTAVWATGTLTITYAVAPQAASGPTPADSLYVQGLYAAA